MAKNESVYDTVFEPYGQETLKVLRILRKSRHHSIFFVSGTGACFSKVPKLFGRISGDISLFVSSKRKRIQARNFAVIFIFIPFTTYEKTSFTE